MSFSRAASAFHVLLFALLLQKAFGLTKFWHTCTGSSYEAKSPYASNVKELLDTIKSKPERRQFSVGKSPHRVYAFNFCGILANNEDCNACLKVAADEVRSRCPSKKQASVAYDQCTLTYTNIDAKNSIDRIDNQKIANLQDEQLKEKKLALLRRLAINAYTDTNRFATGSTELGQSRMLDGLVQCPEGISAQRCYNCLNQLINTHGKSSDGKQSGMLANRNCSIGFDVRFVPWA